MLSYSCRGISVICSEQPHLPQLQQRAALGVSEAVSVLVAASAAEAAVQDEDEGEEITATTISHHLLQRSI